MIEFKTDKFKTALKHYSKIRLSLKNIGIFYCPANKINLLLFISLLK